MSNKKYYWLKLKNDFFNQKEIKKLRRLAGGAVFTLIYMKMQVLSLKDDGKLFYEGTEKDFAEQLSFEIDENYEDIKLTLLFLESNNLIEKINEKEYFLLKVLENTGKEGQSAERIRKLRNKDKILALQCNTDVTKCNTDVTKCNTDVTKCNTDVTKCNTEKEKELEKEKEKELDIEKDINNNINNKELAPTKKTPTLKIKINYAEFVNMQEKEYDKLIEKCGNEATLRLIEILDNYKGSKGADAEKEKIGGKGAIYQDDYRAILSWVVDRYKKEELEFNKNNRSNSYNNYNNYNKPVGNQNNQNPNISVKAGRPLGTII